jgi:putative ABC transport system substrate-binding protein
MNRRSLITLLGGAAASSLSCSVLWPRAARAQRPSMPVIGVLGSELDPLVPAFHKGLAEVGYVDGRNVAIEYRWAEGHLERYPEFAADLVRRPAAVIAAVGGFPAAAAAKAATSAIPVVFQGGFDPVETGLVASLSARALGVQLRNIHARTLPDFDAAIAGVAQLGAAGLVIGIGQPFTGHSGLLGELAARHGLPAIFESREFVAAGGLVSYMGDRADAFRLVGVYVGRILKGEKPADLPVQQSTKVELIVNLKTAKALGIDVPVALLARADEVIE